MDSLQAVRALASSQNDSCIIVQFKYIPQGWCYIDYIYTFGVSPIAGCEEAPSVYIRPLRPGPVTAHQGQLPRDDCRDNFGAHTKAAGGPGQTHLVPPVESAPQ